MESTESEKALIAQINFEPSRATHDGDRECQWRMPCTVSAPGVPFHESVRSCAPIRMAGFSGEQMTNVITARIGRGFDVRDATRRSHTKFRDGVRLGAARPKAHF